MSELRKNSTICRSHACTYRVARDNPTWPYCRHHESQAAAQGFRLSEMDGPISPIPPRSRPVDVFGLESPEELTRLYADHTNARSDVLSPMIRGSLKWRQSIDYDLSVPNKCMDNENGSLLSLRDEMRSEGVPIERIRCVRLSGLNRTIFVPVNDGDSLKEIVQRDQESWTDVIIVDHETPHPIVVDPNISIYAPMNDLDESVHDHFPSGETPFTEEIWIGDESEYLDTRYVWWDNSSVVQWHNRGDH